MERMDSVRKSMFQLRFHKYLIESVFKLLCPWKEIRQNRQEKSSVKHRAIKMRAAVSAGCTLALPARHSPTPPALLKGSQSLKVLHDPRAHVVGSVRPLVGTLSTALVDRAAPRAQETAAGRPDSTMLLALTTALDTSVWICKKLRRRSVTSPQLRRLGLLVRWNG
jgi:hypothetical protein